MVEQKNRCILGKANLEAIKKVKEAVNIPVIGNGDVMDLESAKHMFKYTGVDGVMVARGAMGNPWIFEEILSNKKTSIKYCELKKTVLEHIEKAVEYYGEKRAIPEMRKHIAWYLKGLKNSTIIKNEVNREVEKEKVVEIINKYFNELEELEK